MEKFLEELRRALEEANVDDGEEIVAKYLEHFSLGHEAGMTDEEIIERFDSIEDIVSKASKPKRNDNHFDVILDLDCFSEFKIVRNDECRGIEFDLDEKAYKYVSIIREVNRVHLKSKLFDLSKHFKRSNFEGIIFVGTDVNFDQFTINNVNCDIACDFKIKCIDFSLTNVSGDIKHFNVVAEKSIVISNTSGDIELSTVEAPNVKINSVSGDITIDELVADTVKFSTVSGDISVRNATDAEYSITTISGDVRIKTGVDDSKIKTSTVSGEVVIGEKIISKNISDIIKNSFKW